MSNTPLIQIYLSPFCPYCMWAKKLLSAKGVDYEEIRIDQDPDAADLMVRRSGGRVTVPQIFIGDYHVGGYDDMAALDRANKLDPLLFPESSN
ncbi:MAG: glutaredoxin 3 [bacterium]